MTFSDADLATRLPERVTDVAQLEELLSRPTPGVVEALTRLDGDLLVLGAAGKIGPSLATMARRAFELAGRKSNVIAASRFSTEGVEAGLKERGIETIRCDLLDPSSLAALPETPNVLFLVGMKFGSAAREPMTWGVNTYLPGLVAHRFQHSRIVAFSTGNVYPLSPLVLGGSIEGDPPGPIGEYAMSCLGRERVFEYISETLGTRTALIRLNYAAELRYGVLVDIANKIRDGEPISLDAGAVNVIWQGDANAAALQSFTHTASPPFVVNVAGPEQLGVRRLGEQLAGLMQRPATFTGAEPETALLSNGQLGHELFGYPRVSIRRLLAWVADWVVSGSEQLQKPTHFETRDGRF